MASKKFKLGLFVDDLREPPADTPHMRWVTARTFHMAICLLEVTPFDIVSLDHDLGCFYGNKEMTGRDILNWLIMLKVTEAKTMWPLPTDIRVHSGNPVGCDTMEPDIKKHWGT